MQQPQGVAAVAAEFQDGLLFAYNGGSNSIVDGALRSLEGTRPFASVNGAMALRANGSTEFGIVGNSAQGFASPIVTILVVGRQRNTSGINCLISKGTGGTGFEICLCNQFGSPPARIYSSRRSTGGAQGNFEVGFVNGQADSLNGTFNTVAGQVYAVAASTSTMTQDAVGVGVRLGALAGYTPSVDVLQAAIWVGRRFTPTAVQAMSVSPNSVFDPTERSFSVAAAVSVFRPTSDIAVAGWTVTGAGSVAAAISEAAPSDAEFATSPNLIDPATTSIGPVPAGACTVRVRGMRTAAVGQLRVRLLDAGGTDVGGTAWQPLTSTFTTYTLTATTTATATQVRLEQQP